MLTGVFLVPAATVAAVLVFLILRTRMPFLRLVASPVEQAALRRAADAEGELARANTAIDSLIKERDDLQKERSLAAVIELCEKVSAGVDQTLQKLGELNGGLRHTADALKETHEAMKTSTKAIELLASQIIIDIHGNRGT
jgi:hypothetical protein